VAINANVAWQSYANGIFDDKSCTTDCYDVNHAVTIVGYNLTAPIPYWLAIYFLESHPDLQKNTPQISTYSIISF
jgi:hypothetical protein